MQKLSGEGQGNAGLAVSAKLACQQSGLNSQITVLTGDAEDLRDHGQHIPAGCAGEIRIHTPSVSPEVFGNARVHPAGLKVQSGISKGAEHLPALPGEAPAVQSVCVHHRHMAEHSAVFLFAVGKAKHSAHIHFQLTEVGVQAVAADFWIVQVLVHGFGHGADLVIRGNAAHDGEDLPGEHHPHMIRKVPFHLLPMVIVVAVEPALAVMTLDPLLLPDEVCQPIGLAQQILRDYPGGEVSHFAADGVKASFAVGIQQSLLAVLVLE